MYISNETPASSRQLTVLAVHLYDEHRLDALLCKIKPILKIAGEIWLASAHSRLLEKAGLSELLSDRKLRYFQVDNQWHDWSGYLAFLHEFDTTMRLIICNDSIVTRRVLGENTIGRFVSSLSTGYPAIIGELDTGTCSIDLSGWSSACWISTYLFAIQGISVDVESLLASVESDVESTISNPVHFFNQYLKERRPRVIVGVENRRAKLGAMFFERRLTRLAMESGALIVNSYAGSRLRKIERVLERLRDA